MFVFNVVGINITYRSVLLSHSTSFTAKSVPLVWRD